MLLTAELAGLGFAYLDRGSRLLDGRSVLLNGLSRALGVLVG
jgi:hypothetical protein